MRIDRYKLLVEMAKKDLTTFNLAELAGVSRGTVSSIRSGKACSIQTAGKIARALGVDVTEILKED